MAAAEPKTRIELAKEFPSEEWSDALQEHLMLIVLLESCIIRRGYKIPDELNNAIRLTDAGKKVQRGLTTQEDVPPKEARLVTYLHALHVEPLVDFEATSVEGIRNAVSKQILKGEILYPYTYGRGLYDRAADLFRDERERLKHEETLDLLEGQPPGVFHVGHNLIGPYGLLTTDFKRRLRPRTRIPLQHCSDTACRKVHSVQLTTSVEADINRYRSAIMRVLDETSTEPSDWNGYIQDRTEKTRSEFADDGNPGVSLVLGDTLDNAEMQRFFEHVLDSSSGALRQICSVQGLNGRAEDISGKLSREQMHQLLLSQPDGALVRYLDAAINEGLITIPRGEVRTLRVNAGRSVSAWHLRPQLSIHGYRTVGNDAEVAVLRLGALIRKLYDLDKQEEVDELEWHLRQVGKMPLTARLEHILRTQEPSEIVSRLVFARRANLTKACETLEVEASGNEVEVIARIVWKLGFRVRDEADTLDDYWLAHRNLDTLAKSSSGPGEVPVDQIRGHAATYGVALEKYLAETLHYVWWALFHDHYGSGRSFVYRPLAAAKFAQAEIARAAEKEQMTGLSLEEKPTLAPLMSGFGLLARELEAATTKENDSRRGEDDRPRFLVSTDMQSFPFAHVVPFLDLDGASQRNIIDVLREASSKLQGSNIAAVRNSYLHAGSEPAPPRSIVDALSDVRSILALRR